MGKLARTALFTAYMMAAMGIDVSLNKPAAESILEALQSGKVLRAQGSPCYVGQLGSYTPLTTELSFKGGMIFLQSRRAHYTLPPVAGTGNSVTFKGWSTLTYRLSPDGSGCTFEVQCGQGMQWRFISCSVESGGARSATAQSGPASQSKTSLAAKGSEGSALPTKQANCSDITGTSSSSKAATNCRDAGNFRKMANYQRTRDREKAGYFYKAAEKAFRQAGDIAAADAVLKEIASLTSGSTESNENAARQSELRTAERLARAAHTVETEGGTCQELLDAAEQYWDAGKSYSRAIGGNATQEEFERSPEFAMSNEMYRRRDRLIAFVDQTKKKGACNFKMAAVRPPSREPEDPREPNKKKQCEAGLAQVKRMVDDSRRLGAIGPVVNEDQWPREALFLAIELAANGCVEPGGMLPGKHPKGGIGACLVVVKKWKNEGVSENEIAKRKSAAGC
jgi:hypothetical protein